MRLFISCFFVILLFSCLATKSLAQTDSLTAIHYIVKVPVVQGDRQYFDLVDTTPIYYYQDLIIYQLPYIFDSSKSTYHVQTDSTSNEHILTETRYNYFVFRQGSKKGIWYYSLERLDSTKQLTCDSMLKQVGMQTNLQSFLNDPNDSLLERTTLQNGNIVMEKYITKTKPDESYNDTTFLYYSKSMKPIDFSISPFLDSITNSKLFKLRLVFNETYSAKYGITMPKRDLVCEIQESKPLHFDKLKPLVQRFKQDEKQLR